MMHLFKPGTPDHGLRDTSDRLHNTDRENRSCNTEEDQMTSGMAEPKLKSAQQLLPKAQCPGILKQPFRLPPADPLHFELTHGLRVMFARTHALFEYVRALESQNFRFLFTCQGVSEDGSPSIKEVQFQPHYLEDQGVELMPLEIEPGQDLRSVLFERHGPGIWYGMIGFQRLKYPLDVVMTRLDCFVLPEQYRTWKM